MSKPEGVIAPINDQANNIYTFPELPSLAVTTLYELMIRREFKAISEDEYLTRGAALVDQFGKDKIVEAADRFRSWIKKPDTETPIPETLKEPAWKR